MTADPERREPAATGLERTAHAYCPRCHPAPQPGEVVIALCGATYPFWGRRDAPLNTCDACRALASAAVLGCGHSG
ncbi:hypothetical protein OG943_17340 [Amycolatopsis sp. NBC_00345]|jgi:hypothetical protein|uniref:hypothetical protein n=1 Tax=Amycolatopsis sp. NBC_00345 TaxID=2975955 RepID=UPI002E26601A